MFTLDENGTQVNVAMFAKGVGVVVDIEVWHKIFGNADVKRLKLMQNQNTVLDLP